MEGTANSTRRSGGGSSSTEPVPTSRPRDHSGESPWRIPHREVSVDLRALTYISAVDDNLNCPICQCPFVQPVMTKCDHIFCGDCLNTALRTSLTCPVDRGPLSSEAAALDFLREPVEGVPDIRLLGGLRRGGSVMDVPNAILNMVDELRVKCPNNAVGCNVETARCDIQRHVNKDCGYVKVPCPSEVCGLKVRRKDLESRCLHEVITCDACETDMMEVDLKVRYGQRRGSIYWQRH
jgi:hypothetical protein